MNVRVEIHIAITVLPITVHAAYHAELRFIESPLLLPACFLRPLLRERREVAVTVLLCARNSRWSRRELS